MSSYDLASVPVSHSANVDLAVDEHRSATSLDFRNKHFKRSECAVDYLSQGFNRSNQGISAGWAEFYSSSLDCQWIDITGVADGDYSLYATVNPDGVSPAPAGPVRD